MYNLRYHLASLIAVFLALAIGLVLGTVVAERGMITDQSSALVADLQRRFDEINAANDELRAGLEQDRAFAEDAAETLIDGRLADTHAIVLVGTGRVDGAAVVEQVVTDAGGSASRVTMGVPVLGLDRNEPEGLAGYFAFREIEMEPAGDGLVRQVAAALAKEWVSGEDRALTEVLVEAGVLSVPASVEETVGASALVVMAGAEEACDAFAIALAQEMADLGAVTIGAESAAARTGVASACAAEGLSAVDHVSTPQGRVALVWLLTGSARGYYGTGDAADGLYPALVSAD
ncbi:MAG: copper transporter [Aeromicrobium sp.]|nr:copper transporter [Aeromicrobium sp.]